MFLAKNPKRNKNTLFCLHKKQNHSKIEKTRITNQHQSDDVVEHLANQHIEEKIVLPM